MPWAAALLPQAVDSGDSTIKLVCSVATSAGWDGCFVNLCWIGLSACMFDVSPVVGKVSAQQVLLHAAVHSTHRQLCWSTCQALEQLYDPTCAGEQLIYGCTSQLAATAAVVRDHTVHRSYQHS
jgi:hypothetical protein